MTPIIGLVALAGEYEVGFKDTPVLLESAGVNLTKSGMKIEKAPHIMYDGQSVQKVVESLKGRDFDVLCICVGTWSEDHHLLDLLDYYDKPVILWAFPAVETGSLCGVQQICCVLKELGRQYFYVYGNTDAPRSAGQYSGNCKDCCT